MIDARLRDAFALCQSETALPRYDCPNGSLDATATREGDVSSFSPWALVPSLYSHFGLSLIPMRKRSMFPLGMNSIRALCRVFALGILKRRHN